jgi:cytochrome c biogenesis protein CcdA
MLETITQALQDGSSGAVALPLAFALGLVSALASACCTLPAMSMLVAYSGTRETRNRRSTVLSALWFLLGTTLALIVLGFIAGLVGQAAQAFLGRYWKLFAGVVAVLVGLGTLKLLPLPTFSKDTGKETSSTARGGISAALGGLFLGGGVAACSLPCNPGIFIVLGAAVLQGHTLWGMSLMAAFAVGFSLPLAAILFGVSFGKASMRAGKADAVIRTGAGVVLIGAGLYLLATF